jgi:hypothetical protein
VGLAGVLGSVLNRQISLRMAELKAKSMDALEDLVGRRISYGSISPSFLRYLEIRDLTIYDADESGGSGKALLTIHRLRMYYSLARLLARRDPVEALTEIRIVSSRFAVDLDRDKDLVDLATRLLEPRPGQSGLHARLTGADVELSVAAKEGTFSLSRLFFEIAADRDIIDVSMRGDCAGSLPDGFWFSSSVKAAGKVGRSFDWSDLTVRVASFASAAFTTGKQTLQLVWKGSTLTLDKIQDRSPIDLRLAADLDRREVTLSFQTEQFRPDALFRLSGKLAPYNKWLAAPVTGSGTATYNLDARSLAYSADVAASFTDQLPLPDVQLSSRVRGTRTQAWFEPLHIESPSGSLDFIGNLLFENYFPEGLLTLANLDTGSGDQVNATISIERIQGKLSIAGGRMAIGSLAFDRLDASLSPAKDGFSFDIKTSFADASANRLEASGTVAKGTATIAASLRDVPPDRLYRLAAAAGILDQERREVRSFLGPFALSADLTATTDLKSFSVSSPKLTLTRWDEPGTRLSAAVEASPDRVAVTGLDGAWRGITVQGDFASKLEEAGKRISFSSDLRVQATPYSLKGTYSDSEGLSIKGAYGLALSASRDRAGSYTVNAHAERLPLPILGRQQMVSFDAHGFFPLKGEWNLASPSIVLFDLPILESKPNHTEFSLVLRPDKIELPRIRFSDGFSTLEGSGAADIAFGDDPFDPRFLQELSIQAQASLASIGSAESYAVKGGIQKGALAVQLSFSGSPLARMGPSAVKGKLAGSGTVTGPLAAPVVDVSLTLKEGKLGSDVLGASGRVRLAGGVLLVRDLSTVYVAHALSAGAGSIDLAKGTFAFSALYKGEWFADIVRFSAGLQGTFSGRSWDAFSPQPFSQDITGRFSLSDITVNAAAMPSWGVALRTEHGALRFDGGPGESIHGTLDPSMVFRFSTGSPLPVVAKGEGKFVGDRLVSTIDVASVDLRVLNAIMKSPIVSFTSGVASGRVTIDGPVNDPDYLGSLDLIGGGLLVRSYSPDEAGPISTRITFDRKVFHTDRIVASVGGARMSGQAQFMVDHWVPMGFDISLATEPGTPVHLAATFGSLIADGRGAGQARIVGNDRRTDITGNLVVTDCRITLGPYPGGVFVPEDPPTFVNFTAVTGKRVEFSWPSEAFPVVRTTASPGGKIAITYSGDTGGYTVKGSTEVLGGEIFYFDRSFVVKSGTIGFDETEKAFDPRITARAEVREWDPRTSEEVKIYLDADSRLSEFSPRFSSDPSRTDVDILAMIGAPIFGRAEEQGLGMSALMLSSDILSHFGILRPFERRVRELLNLDMFSIRTQLIQNLVAEKLFGAAVNPLDNTAVSLGKYLGNDLFLEMLVRLQSRPTAPGELSPAIGLRSDLELNLEWATPFFLLEWSFLPRTPETLFLADNSLSMKWRYSY